VQLACSRGLSQRRACGLCRLARSTCRYRRCPKREDEAVLVERLQQFARRRRRRGYRLAHRELCRDGFAVNHKRVYRLWKQHQLTVPARRSRQKRRTGASISEVMATAPGEVWCLDFLEERTLSSGRVRVLCISDEFTRQSLAIVAGSSFGSERVCRVLEGLFCQHGTPRMLRMDNGPEFIALALRGLCHQRGIRLGFIAPGKPWQNGFAESFHARLRDEFLDGEVFLTVREAQVRLDMWRHYWNQERLHSSLGYVPPDEFAARWVESGERKTENALRSLALIGS
jgi:putative transposase